LKKKLDLAVIILCKDSSESLLNALISAKSICRQVIVLDTGSKDDTPKIAARFGVELHFFQWVNDFSKARNYALQFVRTEWVLMLDSDEMIDIDSYYEFIEKSIIGNEVGGIRIKIKNVLDKSQSEHKYTRLFKSNKKILFKGKIHEQIAESITDLNLEIIDSDILIYHWGYAVNKEERITRNRLLLEEEIKENPNDPWLLYHLAETEFSAGNFANSQELFFKIYESEFLTIEQKEISRIRLAQICLKDDKFDELDTFLDFVSLDKNKEGFRLYILATSFLVRGKVDKTKEILDKFIVRESDLVPKDQLDKIIDLIKQIENT
jgi:glycosyltransferase involved in cell wall biosynthesis